MYQLTHSASWAALIYGLNILPNIIVQPLVGLVVEKMDKKKVIVFTHLARAIVISAFVLMYLAGIVNPYIMMAFTLVITTIESINLPATGAFVPMVISKEKLPHAMSLNSSLSSAVALVGTGIAGVIIAKLGVQTAMFIDVATFFAAAAGVLSIRTLNDESEQNQQIPEATTATPNKSESYWSMLKDGIAYVAGNRVIVNFGIMAIFMNFLLVPLNSLEAPIAEEVFGLGSGLLSVMGATSAAAMPVGSLLVSFASLHLSPTVLVAVCGIGAIAFMVFVAFSNLDFELIKKESQLERFPSGRTAILYRIS